MASSALWRTLFAVAVALAPLSVNAGEIADKATEADQLLASGKPGEALASFDRAASAFFDASPLQLRVVAFADKVTGFGDYERRPESSFKSGDTLLVYLEPVGFAFASDGDRVKAALAADVEIRTPGGLILGRSPDFAGLEWNTRAKVYEVNGTISLALPQLKAGDYQLFLTLRDLGSPKTTNVTLPFSIAKE